MSGITRLPNLPLGMRAAPPGGNTADRAAPLLLRVVAVDDGSLWLRLRGRLYRAEPPLELRPGTLLRARFPVPAEEPGGDGALRLRLEDGRHRGRVLRLRPAARPPAAPGPLRSPSGPALRAATVSLSPQDGDPFPPWRLLEAARGLERRESAEPPASGEGARTAAPPASPPGSQAAVAAAHAPPFPAGELVISREAAPEGEQIRLWRFEIDFAALGRVRIELLVRGRARHLRLCSERPLPPAARREIADLFGAALEIAGLGGELVFVRLGAFQAARVRSDDAEGFLA